MNLTRTAAGRIVAGIGAVTLAAIMISIPATSTWARVDRLADGTSAETIASVLMEEGGGSRLVVMHFTLASGATIQAHSHSGPAVLTVLSGSLQTELIRGEAMVNRGGSEEPAEIGEPVYLYDGESIAFAPKAGETITNFGNEPLTLVASILLKSNEPIFDYDYWTPQSRPNLQ